MEHVKVYINDKKDISKRHLVNAELVKMRKNTMLVRLSDGNVIVRRKNRDLPKE